MYIQLDENFSDIKEFFNLGLDTALIIQMIVCDDHVEIVYDLNQREDSSNERNRLAEN